MSLRGRKTSEGMSATATAVAPASTAAPAGVRNGADAATTRVLRWDEWFQHASVNQRADMLALAARQGLVYAHQVPHPVNGVKNKQPAQEPNLRLSNLLAGKTDDLAPVITQPLNFVDPHLDVPQREAVARAVSTPDIFLMQGLPGTGRSRVVAEIVLQAALRGERVLFLANHASSLDAVLARLVKNASVLAVRFLDPGEMAIALPPDLIACTLSEHQRAFKEQVRNAAEQARARAAQALQRRPAEEGCWAPLSKIAECLVGARHQAEAGQQRLGALVDDVQREAASGQGAFAAQLAEQEREYLAALEANKIGLELTSQKQAQVHRELEELRLALQDLRPLAEAKKNGRWWAPAWWRATWRGQVPEKHAELESRRQVLEEALQTLGLQLQDNHDKRRSLDQEYQAQRSQCLDAEIERRRRHELHLAAECQVEQDRLLESWQHHVAILDPAHRPAAATAEAIATAFAAWRGQCLLDDEAYQFASRWKDFLAQASDQLAARIPEWANVLAGTMTALGRDSVFAAAANGPFDLLVLEEADQLTETDLLQTTRAAARWVLVAETHGPVEAAPGPTPAARSAGPGPVLPSPGCFQKLWHTLHCDSRRLHYAWSRENARLCCTLRPVAPHDRAHLEIERVADFPEIELRILAAPKAPPLLAQVVFPSGMTTSQAKEFIFRELQEFAVQGSGRGAWLVEDAACFRFHLGPIPLGETVGLDLDRGLREWIAPATAQTCRLEFERAAGWTRAQVDQWLQRHLHLRDLGRTMALQVPYRMLNGLAGTLNDILFAGEYLLTHEHKGPPGLEFVAVPPLRRDPKVEDKARAHAPGMNGFLSFPREGAGLEQDLATHRSADRLPSELRSELPRRGFVNYLEAQALMRKLEELVTRGAGAAEPIAVIALNEGQVELLRRLAARSECLRQHPRAVEIGLPGAFQERERMTVLVSLTRSHSHRAVPFGDREKDLALALTRARQRLILFGDPGTLVKRSHWHGPLDHLGAAAAALEARRITALLRWLAASWSPA